MLSIRLGLCILVLILPLHAFAQTSKFSISQDNEVCPSYTCYAGPPAIPQAMSITYTDQKAGCTYEWEIENGVFLPDCATTRVTTNPYVVVLWDNTTEHGVIRCRRRECDASINDMVGLNH